MGDVCARRSDIKPENVLIRDTGSLCLIDFGVSVVGRALAAVARHLAQRREQVAAPPPPPPARLSAGRARLSAALGHPLRQ